jgi:hypothetical protein
MSAIRNVWRFVLAALLSAATSTASAQGEPTMHVEVACARGETIAHALTLGDERKPLEIVVNGTCAETVEITRNDVTLVAGPGGGVVAGATAELNTIVVKGSRVTIDGITVTGGRDGISGQSSAGLVVRKVTVADTGRSGIVLTAGASATIDGCTATRNPRDGIVFESASGFLLSSIVSLNGRNGVTVTSGSGVRVGIDSKNQSAGNVITRNVQAGVNSGLASSIFLGASEISWNGTGVIVVGAAASIVGGNTIVDNSSSGVAGFRSASITVGDTGIGIDTRNTISRNGKTDGGGGVFAFQGSTAIVRNALVSENRGFGVGFNLRSAGQIVGSTITGNDGDGVRMAFGGGLFVGQPASTVSGNAAWGLNCQDGESSYVNGLFLTMSGNPAGNFAPGCTGF